MILKTKEDIEKIIKSKVTVVTCICENCNKQYSVAVKILKKTKNLLCRKCNNIKNNEKRVVIIKKEFDTKRGYSYNNIYFDSSWKLAFYIWLKENNKQFIYQPEFFIDYIDDNGINRRYSPDFLVEGKFYEIKGSQFFNEKNEPYNHYTKSFWWNKYNCLIKNNIYIMKEDEVLVYVRYVNKKYGNKYLKSFKVCKK